MLGLIEFFLVTVLSPNNATNKIYANDMLMGFHFSVCVFVPRFNDACTQILHLDLLSSPEFFVFFFFSKYHQSLEVSI